MNRDWKTFAGILTFAAIILAGTFYGIHVNNVEQAKREAKQAEFEAEYVELQLMYSDLVDVTADSYLIKQGISPAKFDSVGDEIIKDALKYYEIR